ncbi:hypothetical protein EN851_03425 [Mesorhizobium sp. M8A.F.Ca.ET.208.01.1.1]|uniref:hypothetical protein n=1 Tax=unclassified Mesorhizobium TaxID=325217 RepID=UPI0010934F9F|nr:MULTISPECIES: hypothetical protein [unclassified Mesorhizobium]TGQ94619.1 hypothetical protein EN851_03425 [Mesorhizobium sp. M8A.F.Ca.ET.208.01.1.1]TGT55107.1 hypothetical protein EN810_03425 [Mesorhizobium sp. M8A.F.Ca.ET.167.01.1.1]
MPIKRRVNKRAERADFPVTPELMEAFRNYIASEPVNPVAVWPEYWRLADLLEQARAPVEPLLGGCMCWHPREGGMAMPEEVAVYRRLASG